MKYTGNLNQPIKPFRPDPLTQGQDTQAEIEAELDHLQREIWPKVPDLFKAHGVEVNDWPGLAIALAKAHVPGFQIQKRGRPPEWAPELVAMFTVMVDTEILRRPGLTVAQAIEHVKQAPQWAGYADKTNDADPDTLRKRYESGKRNPELIEGLVKAATALAVAEGRIHPR